MMWNWSRFQNVSTRWPGRTRHEVGFLLLDYEDRSDLSKICTRFTMTMQATTRAMAMHMTSWALIRNEGP